MKRQKIKSISVYINLFKKIINGLPGTLLGCGDTSNTKQTIIPPFWAHILVKGDREYKTK